MQLSNVNLAHVLGMMMASEGVLEMKARCHCLEDLADMPLNTDDQLIHQDLSAGKIPLLKD